MAKVKKAAKRAYTKRAITPPTAPAASNGFDISAFDFSTTFVRSHGYDLRVIVNMPGVGQRYSAYFNQTSVVYKRPFREVVIGTGTYNGKDSIVLVFDSRYHKAENFTISEKQVLTAAAFCLKVLNFFGLSPDKLTEKFSVAFRLVELDASKNAYLLEVVTITKNKGIRYEG